MGVLFLKNYLSIQNSITTKKVSKYGVFSGPYFPVFGRNTEIYRVNLRIQSEYRKIRTRKTPYLDTFHAVYHIGKAKTICTLIFLITKKCGLKPKNNNQKMTKPQILKKCGLLGFSFDKFNHRQIKDIKLRIYLF